jgi:hypothetical protein
MDVSGITALTASTRSEIFSLKVKTVAVPARQSRGLARPGCGGGSELDLHPPAHRKSDSAAEPRLTRWSNGGDRRT